MGFYFIFKMPRDQNDPLWGLKTRRNSLGKNRKKSKNVKSKYHHHGSKSIVMVTNDLWGALMSVPDVDEAPLEPESSSEELWPELLLRLLLALSGTDTLAEVVLVTDTDSTFSWVLTAAFFWLGGKKRGKETLQLRLITCKWKVKRLRRAAALRPGVGVVLLLLQYLLAKPLTAAEPIAAFDSGFVLWYDCSDSLLKEGREP